MRANTIDTGFIERELKNLTPAAAARRAISNCARRVAAILGEEAEAARREAHSPWQTVGLDAGRPAAAACSRSGTGRAASTRSALHYGNGPATLSIGEREFAFASSPAMAAASISRSTASKSHVVAVIEGHELYLRTRNGRFDLHWVDPFGGDDEEQVGEDKIVAPLPGTVVALLAEVGAKLEKGAPILTLEVMKMEQTLRAPFAGVLKAIKCKVGDIVRRRRTRRDRAGSVVRPA